MRSLVFGLVFAMACVTVMTADEQKNADNANKASNKDSKTKLQGTYKIVSGERAGKPIPEDEIRGSVVTFTENKVYGTDKDRKQFFAATYTIDESGEMCKIKMTSTAPKENEKAEGIVKKEGDKLKICYSLPGGETPTSFSTKEKQQCFVLMMQDAKNNPSDPKNPTKDKGDRK